MFNMTNRPIIRVHNVSKHYNPAIYRPSLRHEATQLAKRAIQRNAEVGWRAGTFWALNDVSFEIERGESVAIMGRNGAGKTTLLRILSGVTAPSAGTVEVNGRFASLLGLGAGFNKEHTGRQNIYLNCAIFGVEPDEVDTFIDDIVEFSELGDFIEEPVKTYSSGMTARLGFSIAVHILPDMIFLDEVLAVGDSAFREKSTERLFELLQGNATLLFVSHSARAVSQLCNRAILLEQGNLIFDGDTEEAIEIYNARSKGKNAKKTVR